MFIAKILSGCWDEETIELTGMPKDFILSARTLHVLENDEFQQFADLVSANKRLQQFVEKWEGHEEDCDYLDEGSPRTDCTCGYEIARNQAIEV